MKRRDFLTSSVAAGTVPAFLGAQNKSEYRTALIGSGWWGMNILRTAVKSGECTVVGMCDVDRNQLDPAVEKVAGLTGDSPKKFGDYRELLDQVRPDIAIVATPDHWPPLVTIAAVKSGAHVYVEKPASHNIWEGRKMIEAWRKYGQRMQVGLNNRSATSVRQAIAFLHEGGIGDVVAAQDLHRIAGDVDPIPHRVTEVSEMRGAQMSVASWTLSALSFADQIRFDNKSWLPGDEATNSHSAGVK